MKQPMDSLRVLNFLACVQVQVDDVEDACGDAKILRNKERVLLVVDKRWRQRTGSCWDRDRDRDMWFA